MSKNSLSHTLPIPGAFSTLLVTLTCPTPSQPLPQAACAFRSWLPRELLVFWGSLFCLLNFYHLLTYSLPQGTPGGTSFQSLPLQVTGQWLSTCVDTEVLENPSPLATTLSLRSLATWSVFPKLSEKRPASSSDTIVSRFSHLELRID